MDKCLTTLDEALQYVKSAVTNQRVILGSRRLEMKRVVFEEETDEAAVVIPTVRAVRFKDQDSSSNLQRLDHDIDLRRWKKVSRKQGRKY
jgi:hypothetical protein